jgi:hypothetical protein
MQRYRNPQRPAQTRRGDPFHKEKKPDGGGAGLPALGVDIAYPKFDDGSCNFDRPLYLNPLSWDEWVKLPVRDFDFSISTPKLHLRVPTVIVSTTFDRIPRVTRAAVPSGLAALLASLIPRSAALKA